MRVWDRLSALEIDGITLLGRRQAGLGNGCSKEARIVATTGDNDLHPGDRISCRAFRLEDEVELLLDGAWIAGERVLVARPVGFTGEVKAGEYVGRLAPVEDEPSGS